MSLCVYVNAALIQKTINFLSKNFGARSPLSGTLRAPIRAQALRLQPHQPHVWSGPGMDGR